MTTLDVGIAAFRSSLTALPATADRGARMRRRAFISLLGGAACLAVPSTRAAGHAIAAGRRRALTGLKGGARLTNRRV
jgi:hypothetical protein